MRLSVTYKFKKIIELYWIRPTNVTKQVEMISCLFTNSPGVRVAGLLEELKLRLTQPSLAGTGAERGNIDNIFKPYLCSFYQNLNKWIPKLRKYILRY